MLDELLEFASSGAIAVFAMVAGDGYFGFILLDFLGLFW